jgi:hypothetical protein
VELDPYLAVVHRTVAGHTAVGQHILERDLSVQMLPVGEHTAKQVEPVCQSLKEEEQIPFATAYVSEQDSESDVVRNQNMLVAAETHRSLV